MNNPIFYQAFLGIGVASTLGAIGLILPEMAKSPPLTLEPNTPSVAFPSNSELRAIKLKNGETLAVVKMWGYTYNPVVPPATDIKILQDAIASNGYSLILLESDGIPPILGWYLEPNQLGNWQLFQVTQQFKKDYKEIFQP